MKIRFFVRGYENMIDSKAAGCMAITAVVGKGDFDARYVARVVVRRSSLVAEEGRGRGISPRSRWWYIHIHVSIEMMTD